MYQVFLGSLALPVTPAKIETSIKGRNTTVELINGTEVNILKSAGLTEITFEFMIPAQNYPFMSLVGSLGDAVTGSVGSILNSGLATAILNDLEEKKTGKKVFPFIVARITGNRKITNAYNISMNVTLEDYTIIEDADNGLDTMVSVSLKQYVPYSTKILNEDGTVTKKR